MDAVQSIECVVSINDVDKSKDKTMVEYQEEGEERCQQETPTTNSSRAMEAIQELESYFNDEDQEIITDRDEEYDNDRYQQHHNPYYPSYYSTSREDEEATDRDDTFMYDNRWYHHHQHQHHPYDPYDPSHDQDPYPDHRQHQYHPEYQHHNAKTEKRCGLILPEAASEIDFDIYNPPCDPSTWTLPSKEPIYESPVDVTSVDVVVGTEQRSVVSQLGNVRFLDLVQDFVPLYAVLTQEIDKSRLARTIVLIIRNRRGRFLQIDETTQTLYEVGDSHAEKMTRQTLREGRTIRRAAAAATTKQKRRSTAIRSSSLIKTPLKEKVKDSLPTITTAAADITAHPNDVLCGRGGRNFNSHRGNAQFRVLVEKRKRAYLTARCKREKSLIVSSIVNEIRAMDPPGRFLARTNHWYDIGNEKARKKTSTALRENAPSSIREEIDTEINPQRTEMRRQETDEKQQPPPTENHRSFGPSIAGGAPARPVPSTTNSKTNNTRTTSLPSSSHQNHLGNDDFNYDLSSEDNNSIDNPSSGEIWNQNNNSTTMTNYNDDTFDVTDITKELRPRHKQEHNTEHSQESAIIKPTMPTNANQNGSHYRFNGRNDVIVPTIRVEKTRSGYGGGRKNEAIKHHEEGNKRYRNLITKGILKYIYKDDNNYNSNEQYYGRKIRELHSEEFIASASRDLVLTWRRQQTPPGRFLQLDQSTRDLYDVGDKIAISITSRIYESLLHEIKTTIFNADNSRSKTRQIWQQQRQQYASHQEQVMSNHQQHYHHPHQQQQHSPQEHVQSNAERVDKRRTIDDATEHNIGNTNKTHRQKTQQQQPSPHQEQVELDLYSAIQRRQVSYNDEKPRITNGDANIHKRTRIDDDGDDIDGSSNEKKTKYRRRNDDENGGNTCDGIYVREEEDEIYDNSNSDDDDKEDAVKAEEEEYYGNNNNNDDSDDVVKKEEEEDDYDEIVI